LLPLDALRDDRRDDDRSVCRNLRRSPLAGSAQFNIATRAALAGLTIAHALRCTGKTNPGACRALTFWDLRQQANRLSNALSALGVGRGDKVALILPQRPETVIAHMAVSQLGAVAVPLSFLFGPDALLFRLDNSETKVVFADPQSLPNFTLIRDKVPAVTHVIGVAGAAEAFVTPYETLIAKGSPHFNPGGHRLYRSRDPRLYQWHHGPPERGVDAAAMPARQSAGLRPLA
jgi:acetyl-CoA synthetase